MFQNLWPSQESLIPEMLLIRIASCSSKFEETLGLFCEAAPNPKYNFPDILPSSSIVHLYWERDKAAETTKRFADYLILSG